MMCIVYQKTDPISPAGRLIPKRRAPKCSVCYAVLWKSIYPPSNPDDHPMYNERGERLGYVPCHRMTKDANGFDHPICWNGEACKKRAGIPY